MKILPHCQATSHNVILQKDGEKNNLIRTYNTLIRLKTLKTSLLRYSCAGNPAQGPLGFSCQCSDAGPTHPPSVHLIVVLLCCSFTLNTDHIVHKPPKHLLTAPETPLPLERSHSKNGLKSVRLAFFWLDNSWSVWRATITFYDSVFIFFLWTG